MGEHGHHATDEGQSHSSAYETRDIKVRPLAGFIAGLTVVTLFCFLVVLYLFRLFSSQHAADATLAPAQHASQATAASADEQLRWPEPRIQVHPADDLKSLREREDRVLSTYGWVDRDHGVVHIPIDVAMTLVEKEGLPSR